MSTLLMAEQTGAMPFGKHERQLVRESRWFNSGPPPDLLREHPITPNDLFFTRNHAGVPAVDAAAYRLRVNGRVDRPFDLSLEQLKNLYPTETVTATISCAGLRRDELSTVRPIPGEVAWGAEPVSTGVWRGVRLARLLTDARVHSGPLHVAFTGLDDVERHGEHFGFGGSIPLAKALANETVLAWELNGEPLTPVHGFPLRALVPGYIGARSVKWLSTITVQDAPTTNYFQSRAYRMFPPEVDASNVVWEKGTALTDVPLNSVIWSPEQDATVEPGVITVSGWACANGGRTVDRVEVSGDGGVTWHRAETPEDRDPWRWTLWHLELLVPPGEYTLAVRAWDSDGNTQPEDLRQLWNFKGYTNNAWHRVRVRAEERRA